MYKIFTENKLTRSCSLFYTNNKCLRRFNKHFKKSKPKKYLLSEAYETMVPVS